LRIEVASRFVCQHQARLIGECADDGGALLLAARKLMRTLVSMLAQTNGFDQAFDARPAFSGWWITA
jgi:hypothetical protein